MGRDSFLGWAAIVVLTVVCGALGWWLGVKLLLPPERPPPPGLVVVAKGEPVSRLVLPELESGAPFDLSGPGRVRLVNFWASWCGPCVAEMPILDAYAAEQGSHGVQVIGVALDDREDALAFQRRVPVAFTLLVEPAGPGDSSVRLGNARGILPYTVLIDAEGRLRKTHYGAFPDVEAVRHWAR